MSWPYLQLGHRLSIDIDLFTDAEYCSIDFDVIEALLEVNFTHVDKGFGTIAGMGKSYLVGTSDENNVKLDLYYTTDPFVEPPIIEQDLRMAILKRLLR